MKHFGLGAAEMPPTDRRLAFLLKGAGALLPAPALDELGSLYSASHFLLSHTSWAKEEKKRERKKQASYSRRKPLTGWWEDGGKGRRRHWGQPQTASKPETAARRELARNSQQPELVRPQMANSPAQP